MSTPAIDEVLALPVPQLKAKLAEAQYRELLGICTHIGEKAAGQRAELERRIVEHVEVERAHGKPASPEGRAGRGRSPLPGQGAAALRSAAPSPSATHTKSSLHAAAKDKTQGEAQKKETQRPQVGDIAFWDLKSPRRPGEIVKGKWRIAEVLPTTPPPSPPPATTAPNRYYPMMLEGAHAALCMVSERDRLKFSEAEWAIYRGFCPECHFAIALCFCNSDMD